MTAICELKWARLCFSVLIFLSGFETAKAQTDYPSKPIRLITPFNAGGAIDLYSRLIAAPLAQVKFEAGNWLEDSVEAR